MVNVVGMLVGVVEIVDDLTIEVFIMKLVPRICRLNQIQRFAVVCLAVGWLGLVYSPADSQGQMAGAEESSRSKEATRFDRGSGPLAGPILVRGPSAPGVVMNFGGGNRRGVRGFRASLRLYGRVIERLDLSLEKSEVIAAIYQHHDAVTKAYFSGHASEMRRLRGIVRAHNAEVKRRGNGEGRSRDVGRLGDVMDKGRGRDTQSAARTLAPKVEEAVSRLRAINQQKPATEAFMVEIWEALDAEEQGRFQLMIDEIRSVDRAKVVGDPARAAGMQMGRSQSASFLEYRIAFIDGLLATEGEGELTEEDRGALTRARARLVAALANPNDAVDGVVRGGNDRRAGRRRGPRTLVPPKAREIEIEDDDDSDDGKADG